MAGEGGHYSYDDNREHGGNGFSGGGGYCLTGVFSLSHSFKGGILDPLERDFMTSHRITSPPYSIHFQKNSYSKSFKSEKFLI